MPGVTPLPEGHQASLQPVPPTGSVEQFFDSNQQLRGLLEQALSFINLREGVDSLTERMRHRKRTIIGDGLLCDAIDLLDPAVGEFLPDIVQLRLQVYHSPFGVTPQIEQIIAIVEGEPSVNLSDTDWMWHYTRSQYDNSASLLKNHLDHDRRLLLIEACFICIMQSRRRS